MEDRRSPIRTERIGSSNRSPFLLIALLAGAIGLAALKPWDTGRPTPSLPAAAPTVSVPGGLPGVVAVRPSPRLAQTPPPSAAPSTAPTPGASLLLVLRRRQCLSTAAWRLLTMEQSGPLQSRSLIPVTPVAASGPADPSIVAYQYQVGSLRAIGYCVPTAVDPDIGATESSVVIWQTLPGATPTIVEGATVVDPGLAEVGEVYLAPGGAGSWPDARYVFQVPGAGRGTPPGWFALDFTARAGGQRPSPSP